MVTRVCVVLWNGHNFVFEIIAIILYTVISLQHSRTQGAAHAPGTRGGSEEAAPPRRRWQDVLLTDHRGCSARTEAAWPRNTRWTILSAARPHRRSRARRRSGGRRSSCHGALRLHFVINSTFSNRKSGFLIANQDSSIGTQDSSIEN